MSEEVEVQQPAPEQTVAEPTESKSIDDTLRETYQKLQQPEETVEEAVAEEVEESPSRERDEHGRFKAKAGEEQPPEEEQPEVEQPQEDTPLAKAPASWTKEAQEAYNALPEQVKAQVHKREEDFHKGIEQYRENAHIGQVLDKEIRPYADLIQQHGTTAQNVVRDLLATQKSLMMGTPEEKASVVARILRDFQVDTEAVNSLLEKPAPAQPDPQFSQLSQEVNGLKEQLQQAQLAPFIEQVNAFAADPQNEHFALVEDDMNALLAQGRAKDLRDAYDKAVWANPETRAKLLAKQQEDERRKAAEKAAAAKRAGSTNVQRRGTPPVAPATGTIEDTIRSTYRALNG